MLKFRQTIHFSQRKIHPNNCDHLKLVNGFKSTNAASGRLVV